MKNSENGGNDAKNHEKRWEWAVAGAILIILLLMVPVEVGRDEGKERVGRGVQGVRGDSAVRERVLLGKTAKPDDDRTDVSEVLYPLRRDSTPGSRWSDAELARVETALTERDETGRLIGHSAPFAAVAESEEASRERPVGRNGYRMVWKRPFGGKSEAFSIWCPNGESVRVVIGSTETSGEFYAPCSDLRVSRGGVTANFEDAATIVTGLWIGWEEEKP